MMKKFWCVFMLHSVGLLVYAGIIAVDALSRPRQRRQQVIRAKLTWRDSIGAATSGISVQCTI